MGLPKDNIFFGLRLTEEQRVYVDSMIDNQLTVVNAVAGTGKTTLAVATASLLGMKLVYAFSPIEEDRCGFRPGSQEEKEAAYLTPLKDALLVIDRNPDEAIQLHQESGKSMKYQNPDKKWVFPMSHVFTRGINLENCFIIIDEAENWTKGELKKFMSRIHDSAKVAVIGHSGQCDLDDQSLSGFPRLMEIYKDKDYAKICELTHNFRGQLARDAEEI